MAFPAFPAFPLSALIALTLLAASVQSSYVYDEEDPYQPVTSDETVAVGGTVTLTCHVAESDNSSLQWSNTAQQTLYFGEKRALRDNRIQLHKSTPTELSITISDVQLSDDGEYTCSIFTMPVRTARATVTVLGVPGKPLITGFEDAVKEGDSIILTCSSTGSKPPAELHWYRGSERLEGRPNMVESNPNEPTYTVSSSLELPVTRDDNNAMIACAVDHPSISNGDKRTEQPLSVLFSPSVTIKPENDLPREGEKFYLQCVGFGNPEPTLFTWKKKEGELPPQVKADGAFLRFEALNKSDNGAYLCQTDNGIGEGEQEYTLHVQDEEDSNLLFPTFTSPPSTLSSFPFSSLSPSSIPPQPSTFPTDDSSTSPYPSLPSSLPPSTVYSSTPTSSSSSSPPSLLPTSFSPSLPGSTFPPSKFPSTTLSNSLFPDLSPPSASSSPDSPPSPPPSFPSSPAPSLPRSTLTPSAVTQQNGVSITATDNADPTAMSTSSVDHAVIGGVVAVIVFIMLCLLIVFGRYLIRHKGTYLTHEAKGSDDAPDADTAIINAEGGHSGAEDKKEYFI
ncbi:cell adhesion molecule 3 isoform X2 [Astyanax mexicanus]|uniref:cell adhesion molecule 3 isoform X2 n=1 Tax=Astyanax mexicanus TaxID=7994 RepID=UPI0020CAC1F8|nr:cell adhesion molecule 3 isoform X2 [Astyanax mexicanus]